MGREDLFLFMNILPMGPKRYIRNLSDKSKTYTHLIESSECVSEFLNAYEETVKSLTYDQSGNKRKDVAEFSPVRIAYEKRQEITEFKCVIAKEINNTEKVALDFVKKKLPGLPSLINAKYLNFSNDFSLEPPEHKGQRSPRMFRSNPEHNHGFMRHIFRIPEEYRQGDYFCNDEDTRSHSREPKNLTYDWNTLSAKQRAI